MAELNDKTISENEELPSSTQRLFEISMRAMTRREPLHAYQKFNQHRQKNLYY